jgi:molecular chaperone GrpE
MNQENLENERLLDANGQEEKHGSADSGPKPLQDMTKEELLGKLEEIRIASEKNYDLYLRSQAEIENVKKRYKKEREDWLKYSNESLIKDILPSLDNLEKALAHSNDENSVQALREGVELTLRGLKDVLAKSGLEEINARGEAFDPCFHEAVSQVEDDQAKPGSVVQELQKGYLLNKRLIRPAMVVVSKTGSFHSVNQAEARACKKIY